MSSTDTPVDDSHKLMLDPVGDHHKVMLDRLCAAYPRMEREVLDIALYAHEAWERELGVDYDPVKAGEGHTPDEQPDASSDPAPA